jgi:hypothetical protein
MKITEGIAIAMDENKELRPKRNIADPENFEETLLNQDWLQDRSKSELIGFVKYLAEVIRSRDTGEISEKEVYGSAINFPELVAKDIQEYVRFDVAASKPTGDVEKKIWKVVLVSPIPDQKPLALEIGTGVVVGRQTNLVNVDLDLTPYSAENLGVSRIHAAFEPTPEGLFLSDLGSANGTYCNNIRIESGSRHLLKENDVISFALLQFKIKIIGNA